MTRALIKTRKQKETIFFNIFCKAVLSWAGVIHSFPFTLMLLVVIQTAIAVLLFPIIVSSTSPLLSSVSPKIYIFTQLHTPTSPVNQLYNDIHVCVSSWMARHVKKLSRIWHNSGFEHLCSSPVQACWQMRVRMIPKVKKTQASVPPPRTVSPINCTANSVILAIPIFKILQKQSTPRTQPIGQDWSWLRWTPADGLQLVFSESSSLIVHNLKPSYNLNERVQ